MYKKHIEKIYVHPSFGKKFPGLCKKLTEFSRLFKTKSYHSPDELFFAIEDLPAMGKEYWFLYFCTPTHDSQVVLTLGRSTGPVRVNDTSLEVQAAGRECKHRVPCAAVCWMYNGEKKVLFDSFAEVELSASKTGNMLLAQNGENKMIVSGKYPHFNVELLSGEKELFRAKIFPPKTGLPYEMIHLLETKLVPRFGATMINYYFEFEGKVSGRPLSGKAYLQKVVAVLPLAPWNWVRVHFASGAAIDFFTGKPLGNQSDMRVASKAYFEVEGRQIPLNGIKLQTFMEGDCRRWVMTGEGLYLSLQTYSMQPFVMKNKMEFRYDEFLVRATDLCLVADGKTYTLKEVGEGRGIAEDASGYLI